MRTSELKSRARMLGADLVGIADMDILRDLPTMPPDLSEGYPFAVSLAVRLADGVMDTIKDRPTPIYQQHFSRVNDKLERLALDLAAWIQNQEARALPIPVAQTLDRDNLRSYISHKAVAVTAGLGWQGKSLLTVSPRFGPRIRLVTVLTDLPLTPDQRLRNRCGGCVACVEACPAQAIRNVNTEWHYSDREEAIDLKRCSDKLHNEFKGSPFIENTICGVCIMVCPWGRRKSGKR